MSSMIDVAFLLLIYFIVSTSLERDEADMSLTLPGASAAAPTSSVKIDQMIIRIDQDSVVYVNDAAMKSSMSLSLRVMKDLNESLKRKSDSSRIAGKSAMVIIDCHDEAQEQRFIDVLSALDEAGITNINLKN